MLTSFPSSMGGEKYNTVFFMWKLVPLMKKYGLAVKYMMSNEGYTSGVEIICATYQRRGQHGTYLVVDV